MWQDSSDSASFVRRSTSHPTSVRGHCDLSHSSHRPGSRQLTPSFSVTALLLGAQSSSLKPLLHDHLLIITNVRSKPQLPSPIPKQRKKQGPFHLFGFLPGQSCHHSSEKGMLGQCYCNFPSRRLPGARVQAAICVQHSVHQVI